MWLLVVFFSFTQDKLLLILKLERLVKIYTRPNEIPGYARAVKICKYVDKWVASRQQQTDKAGVTCMQKRDDKSNAQQYIVSVHNENKTVQ